MSGIKDKTPFATLLVGLTTALVLLGLGMNASANDAARRDAAAAPAAASPAAAAPPSSAAPATTAPTSAAPAPPAAADRIRATYAGRVSGGGATVAIAVRDGTAIAYVCDGRRTEAWLRGTATGGTLTLTGANGARLTGTFTAAGAEGSIVTAGRRWTFDVPVAKRPSGLYRAAADVRNAKVVGGWIVLPDGTQVGVVSVDDRPAPAPLLDTSSGRATVDGTALTAAPIDGTTGSGF